MDFLMTYALFSLLFNWPHTNTPMHEAMSAAPSIASLQTLLSQGVAETHKRTLECPTGGNTHHVPKPHYPTIAKANKWEGKTMVMTVVTKSGCVVAARVHRSSGHDVLDKEAIKTVLQWSFHPRHLDFQNNQKTKLFLMPVSFSLQEI